MRIQIASDLHLNMQIKQQDLILEELSADSKNVDILVLAGDIFSLNNCEYVIQFLSKKYNSIVYVYGNHEFYGETLEITKEYEDIFKKFENFHYLGQNGYDIIQKITTQNNCTSIEEQRFIGGTLWYKVNPHLAFSFSDFFAISKININKVNALNQSTISFLIEELMSIDIVVTHMAPSYRSINIKYLNNPYNSFFVNDLDKLIQKKKPKLWVHGHVHDPVDYMIGNTRIIANPRGYPWKGEGKFYNPNLIIDI